MIDWFVVRSKARQDGRAFNHLQEQGFKVYCAQILKYDVVKGVAGKQVLSPGYCFVECGARSVASIL